MLLDPFGTPENSFLTIFEKNNKKGGWRYGWPSTTVPPLPLGLGGTQKGVLPVRSGFWADFQATLGTEISATKTTQWSPLQECFFWLRHICKKVSECANTSNFSSIYCHLIWILWPILTPFFRIGKKGSKTGQKWVKLGQICPITTPHVHENTQKHSKYWKTPQ